MGDRVQNIIDALSGFATEINEVVVDTNKTSNYRLALERLSRIANRLTKFLGANVSPEEARRFERKMDMGLAQGTIDHAYRLRVGVYRAYLVTLADELEKHPEDVLSTSTITSKKKPSMVRSAVTRNVFVVHGHDEAAKQEVARLLEKLDLHVRILHERPDKGKTVIEKLEENVFFILKYPMNLKIEFKR